MVYRKLFIGILISLNGAIQLCKNQVTRATELEIKINSNKRISANVRWLRYIYFTSVIRKENIITNTNQTILDVGSY